MPGSDPVPLPEGLPLRLRTQFRITRNVTAALRVLGMREAVIRARGSLLRARRRLFERWGSARYSMPALHQIDRQLDRIINQDGGVFVEAGGHDGFTQSNTYYLERFRGWSGVLVEPMPELAAEARRNRPAARVFECALVPFERAGEDVEMHFGDLFSGVTRGGDDQAEWARQGLVLGWRDPRNELVPGRPLSELLDEAGIEGVDLLSLDVEGYEVEAMQGLDFSRHAPAWIVVEMHDLDQGRAAIGDLLGERYLEHAQLSPLDVLYRRREATASR